MSSLVHGLRAEVFFFGMAHSSLEEIDVAIIAAVLSDAIEVDDLSGQVAQLRWTKGGFARSSTSTWTRFMRRWSSEMIPHCAVSP